MADGAAEGGGNWQRLPGIKSSSVSHDFSTATLFADRSARGTGNCIFVAWPGAGGKFAASKRVRPLPWLISGPPVAALRVEWW
jgi:hypothetical protein